MQEFYGWISYFNHKTPDETELQLAVISTIIAQGLGDKKAKVEKFIINKAKKTEKKTISDTIMSASEIKAAFMGVARKKK